MEHKNDRIFLSIETMIGGGSLALYQNEKIIGEWTGSRDVSKAEDVLVEIEKLFERANVKKKSLSEIIISRLESNLTGGKIGLAIAKGLAKAANISITEVSLFESLISDANIEIAGDYLSIIPVGEYRFGANVFQKNDSGILKIKESCDIYTKSEIELFTGKNIFKKIFFFGGEDNRFNISPNPTDSLTIDSNKIIFNSASPAKLNSNYFIKLNY